MAHLGLFYRQHRLTLYVYSLPGLNLALDSARQALATAEDITDNAYQIASRLIASTEDMSTAFLDFLERFSGICPELQDSLCDNWDNWESCALEGVLGDEVDMPLDWVFEHFSSNQTMALDQANEAQDLIVNIRNTLQTTDNTLGKVEGLFQMSSIFSILLMCLCGFIMASILCRSPRLTAQWQQRCFFPLFMLLVLVAFSFSITFVVTSTVAADACFGSPDEKLLMVLENELSSMRPFTAEIALYVVSGKWQQNLDYYPTI